MEETELTKKPKTLAAYTTALHYFTESCPKLFLQDIDRKDLLKFCAFLRDERKQSPRSVYDKFEILMTFRQARKRGGVVASIGEKSPLNSSTDTSRFCQDLRVHNNLPGF